MLSGLVVIGKCANFDSLIKTSKARLINDVTVFNFKYDPFTL